MTILNVKILILTLTLFCHTFANAQKAKPEKKKLNVVVPVSEDLLRINGHSVYVENVIVKKISESRLREDLVDRLALNIKVEGLQNWNTKSLQAMYQCRDENPFWMIPTSNHEIWLMRKSWCSDKDVRFCLSDSEKRYVCSGWHTGQTILPIKSKKAISKKRKAFRFPHNRTLKWKRSDGSFIKIKRVEEMAQSNRRNEFPLIYSSMLLSAVSSVDAALFLGTGQVMYWPRPSSKGSLLFDPARIGALARFSRSINAVKLEDGRDLETNWFDVSVNYRQKPHGIFETPHIYTFMTYSSYNSLSRTTNRLGGGIGYSFPWPTEVFGWTYPGKIISYVDFSFLPIDVSGDNRGIIVSSKANGIWLFSNNFFVTGDVELRLLNFTLETENSLMRIQFGGGFSF